MKIFPPSRSAQVVDGRGYAACRSVDVVESPGNRDIVGRKATVADGTPRIRSGVTVGETTLILIAWRLGKTRRGTQGTRKSISASITQLNTQTLVENRRTSGIAVLAGSNLAAITSFAPIGVEGNAVIPNRTDSCRRETIDDSRYQARHGCNSILGLWCNGKARQCMKAVSFRKADASEVIRVHALEIAVRVRISPPFSSAWRKIRRTRTSGLVPIGNASNPREEMQVSNPVALANFGIDAAALLRNVVATREIPVNFQP